MDKKRIEKFNHSYQMPYPTDHTVGIFDRIEDVNGFKEDIKHYGLESQSIDVIQGEEGLRMLDLKGKRHSFFARLSRAMQKFWDAGEWEFFKKADKELKSGHFLVTVLTPKESIKNDIINLMKSHYAHDITYFNALFVENANGAMY